MITRNLSEDMRHAEPLTQIEMTRSALRQSPMIWHFLLLPDGEHFVATGHISCFDCALCEEQGDVRWSDAAPVPWRARYADCTDPLEE